jgi:hypothetical protein
MRIKDLILEAFDSSPYQYTHSSDEGEYHSYDFKTDDGSEAFSSMIERHVC